MTHFPLWILIPWIGVAALVHAADRAIHVQRVVPQDVRDAEGFNAAESAGLFVGIRTFDDSRFAEVAFAVDDAIDLAHVFTLELFLIAPKQVVLALAGTPQKSESATRLRALLDAGATQTRATQSNIYSQLALLGAATGTRGVLVVTVATHGFSDQGSDFLVGADSRWRRIQRTGIAVAEVFDDVTYAKASRRLVFLDACRERLSQRTRAGGVDADSAMGQAFADAIAQASGQVVLSGTTPGGYSYDDATRQNGVFTAAILDGLHGAASTDERHFITAYTLANYVNQQVLDWVHDNRPDHIDVSRGISQRIDGPAARLPLAIDPAGLQAVETYRLRREAALKKLAQNLGGPITGAMYDAIRQALSSDRLSPTHPELLEELESLDGSVRSQRSLAYYFDQHRERFGAPAKTVPLPEPTVQERQHSEPAPSLEPAPMLPQHSPAEIRLAQEQLRLAGLRPGPADGWYGPQTAAALRQYQAKEGLAVTGRLDDATQASLIALAAKVERFTSLEPDTHRHKLAFFPTEIKGEGIYHAEDRAYALLSRVIEETELFELTFSYRGESNKSNVTENRKIWEQRLRRAWRYGQPNYDLIFQFGEELGVDAVLMYKFDLTTRSDDMQVFLINIRDKTKYSRTVTTEGEFSSGAGYFEELRTTLRIFDDYKRGIKK